MKKEKEQEVYEVRNYRFVTENGVTKRVEFDTDGYVIPAGHPYYEFVKNDYFKKLKEVQDGDATTPDQQLGA